MDEISKYDLVTYTGIIELDSILNMKKNKANKLEINIIYKIHYLQDLNINEMDLALIVGNLLDNAIDAASKVENKWIEVNIKKNKDLLIIEVKNTFNGIIQKNGNDFITRKNNKELHGLGIINIKEILKKYESEIDFIQEKNIFKVMILFYPK